MFKPASGSRMMFENDGFVNRKGMAWYEALAKGGVGCVIVESPAIDEPLSLKKPGDFRIDDDKYILEQKEIQSNLLNDEAQVDLVDEESNLETIEVQEEEEVKEEVKQNTPQDES